MVYFARGLIHIKTKGQNEPKPSKAMVKEQNHNDHLEIAQEKLHSSCNKDCTTILS